MNAKFKTRTRLSLVTSAMLITLISSGAQTTFTKITTGAIVQDAGQFVRGAWGDFNNDGFLDLIVANWGGRTNVFYTNNGNGTFTKITQGDPVQDPDYHTGPAVGDYDNDGLLDMVLSSGFGAPSPRGSVLYHNSGNGTFSRASGGALTTQLGYFNTGAWADYDNDGFLDLFIPDQARNQLWHNDGDGTFAKLTSFPPASDGGGGPLWGDYDNDGFMDLLITKPGNFVVNFLYHNERNGTFTRVLTNSIATDNWPARSEGSAWGDYDNDGFQDLFVTADDGSPNRLYHNNGNGTFTTITNAAMASRPAGSDSLGCTWGDYDNDGYLDMFVASHNAHNALYHNNGDGTFTQILAGDPVNDGGQEYSLCGWVDYDNDGFLDLLITRNDANVSAISNLLYHNNGNTNAWLEVKLVGTAANRSAIGAKVRAHATIGGKPFWQLYEIRNGGARNVQPLVAHFGLGNVTNVDTLRIEWPSGIVQTLTNVMPRQVLTVVEHQSVGAPKPSFTGLSRSPDGAVNLSVTGNPGLVYLFEASTNLVNWIKVGVRSNATGIVGFTDTKATNYAARFYRAFVP